MRYGLRLLLLFLALLALSQDHTQLPQFCTDSGYIPQTKMDLYASTGRQIIRYDATTGSRLNVVVSAQSNDWPNDFEFGPDHNLYVSDGVRVQRYNPITGTLIDTFIDLTQAGFVMAYNLTFGPDGNLYVVGQQAVALNGFPTTKIARFQGTTGQFIDDFIPQLAGVQTLALDMHFGSDGDLYLLGTDGGGVKTFMQRYSGSNGAFIDTIIPANDQWTLGFSFILGPDHNIYVLANGDRVLRFNGKSGEFIDTVVPADENHLQSAIDLAFGPDGNLYFIRQDTDQIVRFNGTTCVFSDIFINPELDQAAGANHLVFYPAQAPTTEAK